MVQDDSAALRPTTQPGQTPSEVSPISLRLMTCNVRHGSAPDGPNAWEHRKDLLAHVLYASVPHVIGTQECLDFQAEFIASALPDFRWFGMGRDVNGSEEHTALFYRHAVLVPVEAGNFWLSETPEVPGSVSWNTEWTRVVTWARFFHRPTRGMIHVFNTHLDNMSEDARLHGAELLRDRIGAISGPVALLGDFNARGGVSDPWKVLTESGLTDVWEAAEEQVGPQHTFCDFALPDPANDLRIDWILVRETTTIARCEAIVFEKDGRLPTDHFPVMADVTF